jgi:aspartate kinase
VPAGVVPIVTGFIGRTTSGEITTVGRNGSDLTATLVGAAVGAEEVEIWSDTDGVMTADPSVVPAARSIPTMRFDETAELAYFGSRVLHPSTLLPAMEHRIPVRVLNTNRPDHPGTVIHHDTPAGEGRATSIAYKEGQIVGTITSTQMFGEAGFLARVFEVLGRHRLVVDMVSTSEISVSFTTDRRAPLDRALPELGQLGTCQVEEGKTLLVVVGRDLAVRPGVGAKILQAIADAGVNVEMVSYGMKSISLTMLIADADVGRAVSALHARLFEG